jgi:hypothetical protein
MAAGEARSCHCWLVLLCTGRWHQCPWCGTGEAPALRTCMVSDEPNADAVRNSSKAASICCNPLSGLRPLYVCALPSWRQMWWWEEAGLSQAAVLRAVPVLRWRAWAAHCGVLRARRRAFVQVTS